LVFGFGLLLLCLVSLIDYKKQEFKEYQAVLFSLLFFLIGLIQGFNLFNFIVMFFLIIILIERNILYEGDLLISAFAFTFLNQTTWLLLALALAYCLTIFYKEYTGKTTTGFIPYFTISLLLLTPFILI
jgi:hypothetical protein